MWCFSDAHSTPTYHITAHCKNSWIQWLWCHPLDREGTLLGCGNIVVIRIKVTGQARVSNFHLEVTSNPWDEAKCMVYLDDFIVYTMELFVLTGALWLPPFHTQKHQKQYILGRNSWTKTHWMMILVSSSISWGSSNSMEPFVRVFVWWCLPV